jgi:hypothetical protein
MYFQLLLTGKVYIVGTMELRFPGFEPQRRWVFTRVTEYGNIVQDDQPMECPIQGPRQAMIDGMRATGFKLLEKFP